MFEVMYIHLTVSIGGFSGFIDKASGWCKVLRLIVFLRSEGVSVGR